jgi:hypothetical protein
MQRRLPAVALALGLAGLIPFVALAIASLTAPDPSAAQRYLLGLVGYGAVVLAFIGGVHWGFILHPGQPPASDTPEERRDAARLGLGVLPSLIGWAALLTPAFGIPEVGLVVLIVGYVATILTEHQFGRRGLLPSGYVALRWGLSIVVLVVLITVLALRLIGARITF